MPQGAADLVGRYADLLRAHGEDSVTSAPGEYSRLIPQSDAEYIARAHRAALMPLSVNPANQPKVTSIVQKLVAAYPNAKPDPLWMPQAINAFATLPQDIAGETASWLRANLKFLPTIAEIIGKGRELVGQRERIALSAEAHLAEHQRRAKNRMPPDKEAESREMRAAIAKLEPVIRAMNPVQRAAIRAAVDRKGIAASQDAPPGWRGDPYKRGDVLPVLPEGATATMLSWACWRASIDPAQVAASCP